MATTSRPVGLDSFQQTVGEWAEETFPKATDTSISLHLSREVTELRDWCSASDRANAPVQVDAIAEEAADCLLLLLHLAHRCGFSLRDAAGLKFAKNQSRTWGKPDAEGVSEHVRTGADDAAPAGEGEDVR